MVTSLRGRVDRSGTLLAALAIPTLNDDKDAQPGANESSGLRKQKLQQLKEITHGATAYMHDLAEISQCS
jgi:hypothetical protein